MEPELGIVVGSFFFFSHSFDHFTTSLQQDLCDGPGCKDDVPAGQDLADNDSGV